MTRLMVVTGKYGSAVITISQATDAFTVASRVMPAGLTARGHHLDGGR